MVVVYFFLIATTNLCLGYFLGSMYLRSLDNQTSQCMVRSATASIQPRNTTTPDLNVSTTAAKPAGKIAATEPLAIGLNDTLSASRPATTNWSVPKSWSDLAQQLHTIGERIQYARSANDKHLAKEVAAQLRSCAQPWFSHLQLCLDGKVPIGTGVMPAAGADTTDLEMCLAQIETMLSNLELIDWSATTEVVLRTLGRETEALLKLVPQRAAETKKAGAELKAHSNSTT